VKPLAGLALRARPDRVIRGESCVTNFFDELRRLASPSQVALTPRQRTFGDRAAWVLTWR
jgi:hypothetical protein